MPVDYVEGVKFEQESRVTCYFYASVPNELQSRITIEEPRNSWKYQLSYVYNPNSLFFVVTERSAHRCVCCNW